MNPTLSVLEWLATNFHVFGWIALITFLWKVFSFVKNLGARASTVETQISTMSTNCFPTMQKSLLNQDQLLHSIDSSLKTIAKRRK